MPLNRFRYQKNRHKGKNTTVKAISFKVMLKKRLTKSLESIIIAYASNFEEILR